MWPRRLGSEAVWVSVCHAHLQAAGAVGSLRIGRPAVVNEKPLGNLLHSLSRDMLHLKPLRIKKIGWSACQRNNSQSMSRAGQTVFDNSVVHADCAASKPLLAKSSNVLRFARNGITSKRRESSEGRANTIAPSYTNMLGRALACRASYALQTASCRVCEPVRVLCKLVGPCPASEPCVHMGLRQQAAAQSRAVPHRAALLRQTRPPRACRPGRPG